MTQTEILANALALAIIAPDHKKMGKALKLAGKIAAGLPLDQVEQAKALAMDMTKTANNPPTN